LCITVTVRLSLCEVVSTIHPNPTQGLETASDLLRVVLLTLACEWWWSMDELRIEYNGGESWKQLGSMRDLLPYQVLTTMLKNNT